MNNKNLQETIIQSGSDKEFYHEYSRFYEPHFARYRDKNINILEIGILKGYSIVALHSYFNYATIFGIDINLPSKEEKVYTLDRVKLLQIDQTDKTTLNSSFSETMFDIIIDDGSHIPEHQILSFNYLFNEKLKSGGMYICEDLHTNLYTTQKYSMLAQLLSKDKRDTSLFLASDTNQFSLNVNQISYMFIYKNHHTTDAKDTSISSIIFKK